MTKKIIALIIVAILSMCTCVTLCVACNDTSQEEEEFNAYEYYGTDKFIETYPYSYAMIYAHPPASGAWAPESSYTEQLDSIDKVNKYKGDDEVILALKSYVELIGDEFIVSWEETDFTGKIGKMPSEIDVGDGYYTTLTLKPSAEQEEMMFFGKNLMLRYAEPTASRPERNNVYVRWYVEQTINDVEYQFEIVYSGFCTAMAEKTGLAD